MVGAATLGMKKVKVLNLKKKGGKENQRQKRSKTEFKFSCALENPKQ
jgi:hypothetical protein